MRRRDLAKNNIRQAKSITLGSTKKVFRDFVGQSDRDDIFRFRVRSSGGSSVRLKLKGLQANADLQIFSPKQSVRQTRRRIGRIDFSDLSNAQIRRFLTVEGRSRRGGRRNETINVDLDPGTYFIAVSARGNADTRYRLITRATDIPVQTPVTDTPTTGTPTTDTPGTGSPIVDSPVTGSPTVGNPTTGNPAIVVDDLQVTPLYNGSGLPTQQGSLTLEQIPVPISAIPANLQPFVGLLPPEAAELVTSTPFATQTATAGGVVLDTRGSTDPNAGYAGYSNYTVDLSGISLTDPTNINFSPVNPNFPALDSTAGYSLSFDLAITEESSVPDRSGFSLLVVGSDSRAIELDFKSDRIFAQAASFGAAETVVPGFSLSNLNSYTLDVANGGYELFANGSSILSGSLRNYAFDPAASDPPLPANPYATPNFVFLGDLTDGGSSVTTLGPVSLFT
ncbi:MAG: hypothetical protein ACFB4J_00805 [Elainellaceae cyanobacterium]